MNADQDMEGETTMKAYITPMMTSEVFAPNEYIAACTSYNITCNTWAANTVEKGWPIRVNGRWTNNYAAGQTHSQDACGSIGNYTVIDSNNDGLIDRMIENSSSLGELECTLYTDSTYKNVASWNSVSVDSGTIYWTTTDDGRVWHHQGSISSISGNNRS